MDFRRFWQNTENRASSVESRMDEERRLFFLTGFVSNSNESSACNHSNNE